MTILICDDMKTEADKLAELLRGLGVEPVTFDNGYDALEYIHTGAAVDACFLDIVMPEMSGVALAEQLRDNGYSGAIIFLSTSNEYAHESYKVKAFNYLIKPPVREGVEGVLKELEKARREADTQGILVNTKFITRFITFHELSHIEVISHNVHFRLVNGDEIEVYATLSELAPQLLCDSRFIQCHRSYIVNMAHIDFIADWEITMRGGAMIPISRGYSKTRNLYFKWKFGGE